MHNIDYNLRPAKHAERIFLLKTIQKLQPFRSIDSYRYIGFGATFFKDFKMFHRDLGITNMVSIEKDTLNKERYEFNIPYKCIKMEYGASTSILPRLEWNIPTILWLDYIGKISKEMLADISLFCSKSISGNILIVTINVENSRDDDDIEIDDDDRGDLLKKLELRVGKENIPIGTTSKDLIKWGTAEVYRKIVNNKIESVLMAKNGNIPESNKLIFEQLFNFHYADGARMLTTGGIFFERGQEHIKHSCLLQTLPFIRNDESPYDIEIPVLTLKEIKYLESNFPTTTLAEVNRHGIPESEVEKFYKVYRVFPNFASVDT
jgi:hypothetical protein